MSCAEGAARPHAPKAEPNRHSKNRRSWRGIGMVCSPATMSRTSLGVPARFAAFLTSVVFLMPACASKEYVRGADEPGIDSPAMSTGLDKQDIQGMLKGNLNHLRTAPIMDTWRQAGGKTTVAVFPFQNETSEHIESQLSAILSEAETWL